MTYIKHFIRRSLIVKSLRMPALFRRVEYISYRSQNLSFTWNPGQWRLYDTKWQHLFWPHNSDSGYKIVRNCKSCAETLSKEKQKWKSHFSIAQLSWISETRFSILYHKRNQGITVSQNNWPLLEFNQDYHSKDYKHSSPIWLLKLPKDG